MTLTATVLFAGDRSRLRNLFRLAPIDCADILKRMPVRALRSVSLTVFAFGAIFLTTGCRSGNSFDMSKHAASWNASKTAARQELGQIPGPSKNTYLAINQESQWKNPFLSIDSNMIQLRIYLPDENSNPLDQGGLTRITAARKQVLNVRLVDLPNALSSLPDGAWPYGRVIAIAAEQKTPQNRRWFSNNLEVTISALKDMGIVVDDWNNPPLAP